MKSSCTKTETFEDPRGFDSELESLSKHYNPKVKPWTEDEIDTLKRYYYKVPIGVLAEKLGRTIDSVRNKHDRL